MEFIDIYRENPCLWNMKLKAYSNKVKKSAAYELLVEKLRERESNADREMVAKKINNLRSSFRKEVKKVESSMESGASEDELYKPSLWYYDRLLFLKGQEFPQQPISNVKEEAASPSDVNSEADNLFIDDHDDPVVGPPLSTYQPPVKPVVVGKKRRQDSCDNILSVIGERLQSSRVEDEFDIVVMNLGNKLRRLSREQQLFAERLMIEVLCEGELGNLNRHSKIIIEPEDMPDEK